MGRTSLMFVLLWVTMGLAVQHARAEYCAFEIIVRSPDGAPITGGFVRGVEEGGDAFAEVKTDGQGVARICDAPTDKLVRFEVGGNLCGAVSVRYLDASWLETRRVFITYKRCRGRHYYFPGRCLLTVRVRDEKGAPLSGVSLEEKTVVRRPVERDLSDRYGRLFVEVDYGEILESQLFKAGYKAQLFSQQCKPGDPFFRERTVVLSTEQ